LREFFSEEVLTLAARRKPWWPVVLGPAGQQLWHEVTRAYELAPGERETLRQAAQTADIIEWTTRELMGQSMTVPGSMGQDRANPLLAALADQRRVLDTLLRSLALPFPDEAEGHPRSPQQVAAAQARWREQRRGHGEMAAGLGEGPAPAGPVPRP
jgi:hypothetical protein